MLLLLALGCYRLPCIVYVCFLPCIVVVYSGIHLTFPHVVVVRSLPCVITAYYLPCTCWGVVFSPSSAMCKLELGT
jgi:hypothetical protein